MKVIITGTTGYVGEGVMHACLDNKHIDVVLSVSRKPLGFSHPKLKELIVEDFMTLQPSTPELQGYDAVFFCAGITSVGTPKDTYRTICYEIPMQFARAVGPHNKMTFIYLSGAGTSPRNPQAWAKVKSQTEQELLAMPFKGAFGFRPAIMRPHPRQHFKPLVEKASRRSYPICRFLGLGNPIEEVAQAMIAVSQNGYHTPWIGVRDIKRLAKRLD